jgi:hypothetical protein
MFVLSEPALRKMAMTWLTSFRILLRREDKADNIQNSGTEGGQGQKEGLVATNTQAILQMSTYNGKHFQNTFQVCLKF